MTNDNIKEYLDHYINSDNSKFAILIKGSWGSGKTFFIKKMIDEWRETGGLTSSSISIKPIYISLNGLSSIKQIVNKLNQIISPFLYSKGVNFTKEILKGFAKSALKIDLDFNNDGTSDGSLNLSFDPVSIFKGENDQIKGNRIIVLDDIERCKIPLDELFGFINDFIEHSNCKIILISDEEKILKLNNNEELKFPYLSIREKIIGQTFEIKTDIKEAVDFFIESGVYEIKPYLEKNKNLIIKIFKASEKQNLRVLQRALYDFDRLFKNINRELEKKHKKYALLFENYLAYFLIYYMEINTGNAEIGKFQSLFNRNPEEKAYLNYEEAVKSLKLIHSTRLFSSEKLIDFICNGNYADLVQEINCSVIYEPSQEQNWEKLWYWRYLEDQEYSKLLQSVENDFFNTEIKSIPAILHITGIFFSLSDNKLYNSKSKKQIAPRARLLFTKADGLENVTSSSLILRSSAHKDYHSYSTSAFKSVISNLKATAQTEIMAATREYINKIMFGLNDNNIDELYEILKQYKDGLNTTYENTAIFEKINAQDFADLVFNLKNSAVSDLKDYFIHRYYPEERSNNLSIEPFHKKEIKFIKALKNRLSSKKKNISSSPLKLMTLNNFITTLGEISERLK